MASKYDIFIEIDEWMGVFGVESPAFPIETTRVDSSKPGFRMIMNEILERSEGVVNLVLPERELFYAQRVRRRSGFKLLVFPTEVV